MNTGLTKRQLELLTAAAWRYQNAHSTENILKAWTGLGTKTEYAPVVKDGYMVREWAYDLPTDGSCGKDIAGARRKHWFRLTEKGAAVVRMLIAAGMTR